MLAILAAVVALGLLVMMSGWFWRGGVSAFRAETGEPGYRRLAKGWHGSWSRVVRGAGFRPRRASTPGNIAIAAWCALFLLLMLAYGPLLGPVIASAVVGGAFATLSALGQRRRAQIEPLLKDFTAAMADRATRVPLRDAFLLAAEASEDPLHGIIAPYASAVKSGAPFGPTLRQAAVDLDNETFSMVAATVDAAAESSARSVSGTLYRLSASIRDREQARKEIWSAGKTTRLARHIYTVLPPTVLAIGVLSNPVPWQTPYGVIAIAVIVGIVVGGRQLMVWLERWQMDY